MWRRRLKEEAAAAAAAAAAEKRRKQEVAGSSPGEVICFQIPTSRMGSPAPVGGADSTHHVWWLPSDYVFDTW